MSKAESRPRLTAARKFELYLATRRRMRRSARSYGNTGCMWMICAASNAPWKAPPWPG